MTTLIAIILTSFWILGIHSITRIGQLLGFLDMTDRIGFLHYATKPLWDCPNCMASIHGAGSFILLKMTGTFEFMDWWYLLPFCVMVAGATELLAGLAGWRD